MLVLANCTAPAAADGETESTTTSDAPKTGDEYCAELDDEQSCYGFSFADIDLGSGVGQAGGCKWVRDSSFDAQACATLGTPTERCMYAFGPVAGDASSCAEEVWPAARLFVKAEGSAASVLRPTGVADPVAPTGYENCFLASDTSTLCGCACNALFGPPSGG